MKIIPEMEIASPAMLFGVNNLSSLLINKSIPVKRLKQPLPYPELMKSMFFLTTFIPKLDIKMMRPNILKKNINENNEKFNTYP